MGAREKFLGQPTINWRYKKVNEDNSLISALVQKDGKPVLPDQLRNLETTVDGVRVVVSDVKLQGKIPRGNIYVALPDNGQRPAIDVSVSGALLAYPQTTYGAINREIVRLGYGRENGTLSNALKNALAPYVGFMGAFEGKDFAEYKW